MENKFKIWDKTHSKWLTSNCGQFLLNQNGELLFLKNGENVLEVVSDYEIVRDTGLKDKNGKDICEGDIVRFTDGESWQGYYEIDVICIVKWCYCGFDLIDEKEKYGYGWGFTHIGDIEVIGSIYDNPELLEVIQ